MFADCRFVRLRRSDALIGFAPTSRRSRGLRRSAPALAVIVAGAALVVAPTALAATPFTVSPVGEYPSIAVDAAGGAHVAFNDKTTSPDRTGYCRVPRGVTGCLDIQSFGPEGDDRDNLFGSTQVFEHAGTVDVLSYRCCAPDRVVLKRSTNLGLSFGTRQLLATGGSAVSQLHDAVYGPGGSYSWVDRRADFQNAVPGAPVSTSADLFSELAHTTTVGLHANVPVVVYQDFSNANPQMDFFWRMYDGSGPMNDATNWTARQLVAAGNGRLSEARLAEGPSGLFLATVEGSINDQRVVVRKFTGSGFGPATVVSPEDARSIDLHQDASGRLHAVWVTGFGTDSALRWRRAADGASWGPTHTLSVGESHQNTRVAAAADGTGFAVWTNGNGQGGSQVRMVPLEPLPEPEPVVVVEPPRPDPPVIPPVRPSDTTAPAVSGLSVSKTKLKPGQAVAFRFTASEAGSARLLIDRSASGLKMKASAKSKTACVRKTDKRVSSLRKQLAKRSDVKRLKGARRSRKLRELLRNRGCTTRHTVATLTRSAQVGVNTIVFSGKVKGRSLKSGSYRAVLTVTDAAGNVSSTKTVAFKVLAKKKANKKKK